MLFQSTKALGLGHTAPPILHTNPAKFCEEVASFFQKKVDDIRTTVDMEEPDSEVKHAQDIWSRGKINSTTGKPASPPAFRDFYSVSQEEVEKTILKLGPASSALDPIPTSALKNVVKVLLPDITTIVNVSLQSGTVPVSWNKGIITPLPKKAGGQPEDLSNLRPVTQLRVLPRIIEAIITSQLQGHIEKHALLHDLQSGFRPLRGTELATADMREQLLWLADRSHPAVLVLLDLSAAFDTVDHNILLARLREVAGVTGRVLRWMESFLSHRTQVVKIGESLSSEREIKHGVPQGSSLSPVLFNIYLRPLADVLERLELPCQLYADDTQILVNLHETSKEKERLVPCLILIKEWMRHNKLRLNGSKTELLAVEGTKGQGFPPIPWPGSWGTPPKPVTVSKDLGVHISHNLDGAAHTAATVKACHHQLNLLSRIFPLLDSQQRITLYQALVGSRLNYGLIFMLGASEKTIYTLQKVQNRGIRMIYGLSRFHHISGWRHKLKWLRVKDLIKLRTCVLIWKAHRKMGPIYTHGWAVAPPTNRRQREAHRHRLLLPRFQKHRKGGKTIQCQGARFWNALPARVRSLQSLPTFKRELKAHLLEADHQPANGQTAETSLAFRPGVGTELQIPQNTLQKAPISPNVLDSFKLAASMDSPGIHGATGRDNRPCPPATSGDSSSRPQQRPLTTIRGTTESPLFTAPPQSATEGRSSKATGHRSRATLHEQESSYQLKAPVPRGITSPPLPARNCSKLIQQAAWNKAKNTTLSNQYKPRTV